MSAAQAARRPIPGEWSAQEIVDHLLETHRPGVDELRCVLAGQRPPGEPIPAALQSKAPLLRPWSWLLDELRRVHTLILDLLEAVPPDAPTEGRDSLLNQLCGDDHEFRHEVLALLAADAAGGALDARLPPSTTEAAQEGAGGRREV